MEADSERPLRTAGESPAPERFNIADRLRAQARGRPYARAVVTPAGRDRAGRRRYVHLTFQDLDELCDRYALGLAALGVTPGMRVLLMVPPSLEFFGLAFSLFRLGAVPVLIDPAMGRRSVLGAIAEVEAEALVAVPKGHVARRLFPGSFRSVRIAVTVGAHAPWGGSTLGEVESLGGKGSSFARTRSTDLAAILFTSGSTGSPKGVVYTHAIFEAQVRLLQHHLGIRPGEVELSAFPLFSLFSIGMGVTVVVPDMDVTRPAEADPLPIVTQIRDQGVTYAFGSPAFWHRLGRDLEGRGGRLESLERVLMAGAPAPVALLERLLRLVPPGADVFTPYGATESLPVTIPSARALLDSGDRSERGKGACVGAPIPEAELRIVRITDEPMRSLEDAVPISGYEIGEILVRSPVTTRAYFRRPEDDRMAKVIDGADVWHRMGDVGYLDDRGRLWFCGRKSHRVETPAGPMFTVPCESIFNAHPRVYRSALVGIGSRGEERPAIIVECHPESRPRRASDRRTLAAELLDLGRSSTLTRSIGDVLFHPSFPVDARHNAKIRREELRVWAAEKL